MGGSASVDLKRSQLTIRAGEDSATITVRAVAAARRAALPESVARDPD